MAQGVTCTLDSMAWGLSLCAQPACLIQGSNCLLSLHAEWGWLLAQPRLALHAQLGLRARSCSPVPCPWPVGLAARSACTLSTRATAGSAHVLALPECLAWMLCSLSLHARSAWPPCRACAQPAPARLAACGQRAGSEQQAPSSATVPLGFGTAR